MKTVTPAELSANTDQILDEVLESALPVEIVMGSRQLRIVVAEDTDKFQNLISRPDVIVGDPEDLVTLSWQGEATIRSP